MGVVFCCISVTKYKGVNEVPPPLPLVHLCSCMIIFQFSQNESVSSSKASSTIDDDDGDVPKRRVVPNRRAKNATDIKIGEASSEFLANFNPVNLPLIWIIWYLITNQYGLRKLQNQLFSKIVDKPSLLICVSLINLLLFHKFSH